MASDSTPGRPAITAVLGPTNTGKTHLAMTRFLAHDSGTIGFPLRLLARENYERAVARLGRRRVALVTGEEKIGPADASHLICTVEAMPVDRPVSFLAVDEIQLAADPERGRVFTDRLLHARGRDETMFLGAATAERLIRRLVPEAVFDSRPRLSRLTWSGPRTITRLPRRSAVVAFTAADVYGLADIIRRRRGGAAVVLGALSPRTRNAQVGLFESGEVDYLVATDAIGMGLNLNLSHVAFARLAKFDGARSRPLTAAEMGQIAGRAGRHTDDGTFGVTDGLAPLDAETIGRIEGHEFDTLKTFFWRNDALDMSSPEALLTSLEQPPGERVLVRGRDGDDHLALRALLADKTTRASRAGPGDTALLWQACQIPDYRKLMTDAHARLVGQVFDHLSGPAACLPTDWVASQVRRLDRSEGDIDTVMTRIAHVRTWTYIAHRADWLRDPLHWQEYTRALEDRLSDVLHERLSQRFIDRRAMALAVKPDAAAGGLATAWVLAADDAVSVLGHRLGRLQGFRFQVEGHGRADARAVLAQAGERLAGAVAGRLDDCLGEGDEAFTLDDDGQVLWRGAALARLTAGRDALSPRLALLEGMLLSEAAGQRLLERLERWLAGYLAQHMAALQAVAAAPLQGAARGLAFQLIEGLGVQARPAARLQIDALTGAERRRLHGLGVVTGHLAVYVPAVLKPVALRLRLLLRRAFAGQSAATGIDLTDPSSPLRDGRVSFSAEEAAVRGLSPSLAVELGYVPAGQRLVRLDMAERFARQARRAERAGAFALNGEMVGLLGCPLSDAEALLRDLGYRGEVQDGIRQFRRVRRTRATARPGPAGAALAPGGVRL
ncbi:MAG: helicase-related protein [Alphaproteobacteria bacterium]